MNWDDLKQSIGERAKDIIHADKCDGIGKLSCWMTAHGSNPELDWSSGALHFKCHNCGEYWDILDHAKEQAGGDNKKANQILHEYAGIEMDEPKPKETTPKVIEWEGIQPISRERSREMVQYMLERRISEATLKRYHVTGDSQAIYFNYVCDKTLVKIKGRLIGSHANGKDKYSPTPKGGVNTLYGQHTYKKQDVLVICEGEVDALSVFEALSARGADVQISVSSVPSGSSSFGWVANSLPYIKRHNMVIILPDNDEAGKKFASKLQDELSHHVRVATANLKPWKVNDANELLIEHGRDSLVEAVLQAKEYKPAYTVDLAELEETDSTFSESGFWQLDKILYGLQHGMLTLLTGRSGDGKTTILRQIIAAQVEKKLRVGCLLGEESALKFRERYIRQANTMESGHLETWSDDWFNTRYKPTSVGIESFKKTVAPYISLFDNEQLTEADVVKQLFAWVKREASLFRTKVFIIDNLMKLENGSDGQLLESQRIITNRLKTYCEALQIHVILVAHPRKDTDIVTVDSISGSKNITNVVDNVVIFQRLDNLSDDMREHYTSRATDGQQFGLVTSYFKIAKNRDGGMIKYIPLRYYEQSNTIHDLSLRGEWKGRWTIPAREIEEQDKW